jgi:HAD superfamily hydrolase (TIGR01509 family)
MSAIRGLLVDLDGTLVDTSAANFAAYRAALAEEGVELSRDWWDAHAFGRNWRQFLPQVLDGRDTADLQAIAEAKARLYPQFLDQSRVNGSLVLLIAAMRSNVRTALVTTASGSNVDAVLRFHGLHDLFDTIVTGDDVAAHKPAPDAFAEAARRLDLRADECLVIEDSKVGVAAAQAFGAACLKVGDFVQAA